MKSRIAVLALAVTLLAGCATDSNTPVAKSDDVIQGEFCATYEGGVSKPRILKRVVPIYPYMLKKSGIDGYAQMDFIVDATGTAKQIRAVKASHALFAQSAIECLRGWRWKPAMKNGQPVAVRMQQTFDFTINDMAPFPR